LSVDPAGGSTLPFSNRRASRAQPLIRTESRQCRPRKRQVWRSRRPRDFLSPWHVICIGLISCSASRVPAERLLAFGAEIALEMAWKDADAVYISFDIDSVDCGFVPGTGRPEPGGFLPREALALVGKVAAEGICGLEVVEVSPPYDTSDITALLATRVIVDVLGSMVSAGKLGSHKAIIDKPVAF
jgi:arginase family enzyme